ncbi:hypothetical protein [Holospora curviuscula]|uniref:hypothetical protein n=1 Tax=Holospora curviuscula TaxID=1082868 RepID=UPI000CE5AA59|nr:hypothetical protein [Holospora curviuscula]
MKKNDPIRKVEQNIKRNADLLAENRLALSTMLQRDYLFSSSMDSFPLYEYEIELHIQQLELNISRDEKNIKDKLKEVSLKLTSHEIQVAKMLSLLAQPKVALIINFPFAKSENSFRVIDPGLLDVADVLSVETLSTMKEGMEKILGRPVRIILKNETHYSDIFAPYIKNQNVMKYQEEMKKLCDAREIDYLPFETVLKDGVLIQDYLKEESGNFLRFTPYIHHECGIEDRREAEQIAKKYCQMKNFITNNVDPIKIRSVVWPRM